MGVATLTNAESREIACFKGMRDERGVLSVTSFFHYSLYFFRFLWGFGGRGGNPIKERKLFLSSKMFIV